MKQTAVDILYKFLYEMESFNGFDPYNFNHKELFKQAKEMEKEQMNNAYNDDRPNLTIYESNEAFKQYYNETFKSE